LQPKLLAPADLVLVGLLKLTLSVLVLAVLILVKTDLVINLL